MITEQTKKNREVFLATCNYQAMCRFLQITREGIKAEMVKMFGEYPVDAASLENMKYAYQIKFEKEPFASFDSKEEAVKWCQDLGIEYTYEEWLFFAELTELTPFVFLNNPLVGVDEVCYLSNGVVYQWKSGSTVGVVTDDMKYKTAVRYALDKFED